MPDATAQEKVCWTNDVDQNTTNNTSFATTDPVSLSYATYYGQSINNGFNDVAVNANGDIYAFGTTINQGFDAVLVKFNSAGVLIWERFLGGNDAENFNPNDHNDYGRMALDAAGNIYVTGITSSTNFPTVNAFQAAKAGGIDAYVAKYDEDGNLLLSSYLGGAGDENVGGAGGISVDNAGNIFVAGSTTASGFFNATAGAQNNFSGGSESDAFIVRITSDFSSITGSYWGDSNEDVIRDMAISNDGKIWTVGYADESSLTLSGQQSTALGVRDGILIGWENDLSSIAAGTFFGGQFDDEINGIAIDNSGNIHITGGTFSTNDFPTLNAFQNYYTGGQEAFAAKLNSNAQLIWSTFLGASQNELGLSIHVDQSANVYVGGTTASFDFPVSRTVQETYNVLNCEHDAFIFKFNADGTRDWSSFYGGWRLENPNGITVNANDQVIVVGKTESTDLPVTPNAHLAVPPVTGQNAFLSIFEILCPSIPIIIHSTENAIFYDQFWCSRYLNDYSNHFSEDSCALFLIAPPGYTDYSWEKNGNNISGATGQYHSIRDPGSNGADFNVNINNGNACSTLSSSHELHVNWLRPMCGFGSSFDENELPHVANIIEGNQDEFICPGDVINYSLSADGFCGAEFQWQKDFEDIPDATNATFSVDEPGCYRIAIQNTFTGCTVYSVTKKFILLDSVKLNNYSSNGAEGCLAIDTLIGCTSVNIRARIPHCAACDRSPSGLTYTFFHNGSQQAQNTYGWHNTSTPGDYTVEVSNGNCTIASNNVHVKIQPTERPVWVLPSTVPLCVNTIDSLTFSITHPAANDSATIRFDFPYPDPRISGFDSLVKVFDVSPGCMDVRLTTKEGCTSVSERIELHDTLTPIIEIRGPNCVPVTLRSYQISSCHLDSVYWYWGDSLIAANHYDGQITATEPGAYVLGVKNACGLFLSDTVFLQGNLPSPVVSPAGPVCLPENLQLTLPTPSDNIIVKWYRQSNSNNHCYTNASNLIPNENGPNLIANVPGFYFAILEDTLSGCIGSCSNIVEVQRSVAGASISPSNDIYFCDGSGISNVTMNVTPASPSFTYQWYRNSNPITGANSSSYSTNTQGVYRVYLENACDNSFTPVVSIFNIANPTLTLTNPDTTFLCGPDTIRLTSDSDQPLIYQWYKDGTPIVDAIDSIYLATTAGTYEVHGLNNNTQCEDWSREVKIIAGQTIFANINSLPACTGPCTGSLNAIISGGIPFPNGSYQYLWSNGNTTSSISNLCEGNYTLTITDYSGCNTTFSAVIEPGFTVSGVVDSISCFGLSDGKIASLINGGQAPFSYSWNTGDTLALIENLDAGNYALTVSDANSCSAIASATLSEPAPLTMNLTAQPVSCEGESDGLISANFSGGKAPYIYNWSSPVFLDSSMLNAGNYTLTLTDQNGCILIDSIEVTSPIILSATINITNALDCPGDTDGALQVIASGGSGFYIYNWENAETNDIRSGLVAGNYLVTVTDTNNCTAFATVSLTGTTSLNISIDTITDVDCQGMNNGSITLTGTGGLEPYDYLLNGISHTSPNFTNLAPNIYSVQIIDANNCPSPIIDTLIIEPLALSQSLTIQDISCFNASDGSIAINTAGGSLPYQYTWAQTVTPGQQNLGPGWYYLTTTDANSCEVIDSIEIFEPAALSAQIDLVQAIDCFGNNSASIAAIVSGGTTPYIYHWENGASLAQQNNLSSGVYDLTVEDANQCSVELSITIDEPDSLELSAEIFPVNCFNNDDGRILLTGLGGIAPYEYLLDGVSNSNSDFENLSPNNYTVQIIDSNNCTSAILDIIISEPQELIQNLTAVDVGCFNANNGSIAINTSGGTAPYQYSWSQTVIPHQQNLGPGWYYLTTTDTNFCETIDSIQILEPFDLAAQIDLIQAIDCFGSNTASIATTVSGGTAPYIYDWENGALTADQNNLSSGIYALTVVDANQCSIELEISINEPDSLEARIESFPVNCFNDGNGRILLTGNGGTLPYEYLLDGQKGPANNFEALTAGAYEVQIVDANNCATPLETITVESPELLTANINTLPVDCPDANTGAASISVSGGVEDYTINWSNSHVGITNENLYADSYSVHIIDKNNCDTTLYFNIESPDPINSDFEIIDNLCANAAEGEVLINQSTGGTAPYEYYLDDQLLLSTNNGFQFLTAGMYSLTTMDDHGCEIVQEITVDEPEEMIAFLGEDQNIIFGEENALELSIINPGPNPIIEWSPMDYLDCQNDPNINCESPRIVLPQSNISYQVLITDENGCTAVDEIYIKVSRNVNPVYLGNAITPNDDGINDILYVQAHRSIGQINKFQIFNRWGALIFQQSDFAPNDKSFGWDGYWNGKLVDQGVFIYSVEYSALDGKKGKINGDVAVLK